MAIRKYELTKEKLYEEYVVQQKLVREICAEFGCTRHYLYRLLKRYDIPRRTDNGGTIGGKSPLLWGQKIDSILTKEYLIENYVTQKKSGKQIALELGTSPQRVYRRLEQLGIFKRKPGSILDKDYGSKVSLIGRTSGCLTVIDEEEFCVTVRCVCGKVFVRKRNDFYKLNSCGCQRSSSFRGIGEIGKQYYTICKKGADIRKLEFSITIEDIWEKYLEQNGKCALSGVDINFSRNPKTVSQTASLDRIDSGKGYTKDNIQILHKDINKIKGNLSDEDFIKWCELVATYRGNMYERK